MLNNKLFTACYKYHFIRNACGLVHSCSLCNLPVMKQQCYTGQVLSFNVHNKSERKKKRKVIFMTLTVA